MSIDTPPIHDREPQPPTLGELARILGFEPNQTLRDMAATLINPGLRLSDAEIVQLLDEYSVEANEMCEREDKRSTRDDLALMVELAYFRYFKGKFQQVLQDFEDIREILESPDIDNETYKLVMSTVRSVEKEVAAWRSANPRVE